MSQRNPKNARYQEDGKKNVTRKSAGRAKPKSAAASSVYIKGQGKDQNQGGFFSKLASGGNSHNQTAEKEANEKEAKQKEKQERQEARLNRKDTAVVKKLNDMPNYKKYRTWWIALIVVAIVGVVVSFAVRYLMPEESGIRNGLEIAGLVIGYGGLIAALVVDFKCIRPIRKAYTASAGSSSGAVHKESKKEMKHRQEREAAEAARKANKKSLFGRKKD